MLVLTIYWVGYGGGGLVHLVPLVLVKFWFEKIKYNVLIILIKYRYLSFMLQNRFRFTGECNHPEAMIKSCQTAGTQFLITNQKFNITYKGCEGMSGTFSGGK